MKDYRIRVKVRDLVEGDAIDLSLVKYASRDPLAEFEYAECEGSPFPEGENCLVVATNQSSFAAPPDYEVWVQAIPVIFRKWPKSEGGEVIAIMPTIDEGGRKVACYQHIGQHSACTRSIIWNTKPATPEEYASLKQELESNPYNYRFVVRKKWLS